MIENRAYHICLLVLMLTGLGLRLYVAPDSGFFCDVPTQIDKLSEGEFLIQFPGYAPYHLLVYQLSRATGDIWSALQFMSMCCGMASLLYVAFCAGNLAGQRAAILSGGVMALSLFPVYFSVTGTSYTTDMLAASGMLYHGMKSLGGKSSRHYLLALAWLCFGILMRPLSAMWMCPAILYLAYRNRSVSQLIISMFSLFLTAALYLVISIPIYGSLDQLIEAANEFRSQLDESTPITVATNLFRVVMYPIYGLHLWLAISVLCFFKKWRNMRRETFIYLAILILPYFLLMARYIPHAGYYCLMLPALALIPWSLSINPPRFSQRKTVILLFVFLVIVAVQIFVAKPVKTRGIPSAVMNAYFLQYSMSGITQNRFETLSSEIYKAGVDQNYHNLRSQEDRVEEGLGQKNPEKPSGAAE